MKTYEQLMDDAFKEMTATRARLRMQKMKAEADQNQARLNL